MRRMQQRSKEILRSVSEAELIWEDGINVTMKPAFDRSASIGSILSKCSAS
jgi:hypothetical protein